MPLNYDRGDSSRPRGHALLYFRSWADPAAVFATYLIIPPISVEISKYIPPMFAAQFQGMAGGGITVFPYPPIPEKVEGYEFLERLAEARGDDLVGGGSIDSSSPERLLQAASEAAQQYFQGFSRFMDSYTMNQVPAPEVPESAVSVDVNELRYILMGEHERLEVFTKLIGQFRDAVEGGDQSAASTVEADINALAKTMPDKYRVADTVAAARTRGPEGFKLTQLYLDRAFRLADEKYEAVSSLEAEIRALQDESNREP